MIRATLAAMLLLGAGIGSANAAMVPKSELPTSSPLPLVEVQYRDRDGYRGRRPPPPPRWVPGHRYHRSPPGWRRHHRRPHDWRRRGCIIVGPVWFCP